MSDHTFPFRPSPLSISADRRRIMCDALGKTLAALTHMRLRTKMSHWNLAGPWFKARHELFDTLATHLDRWADDVAERIAVLGGVAAVSPQDLTSMSELPNMVADVRSGDAHLRVLTARYTQLTDMVRATCLVAGEQGDVGTEDLLGGMTRQLEHDLWTLSAHFVPSRPNAEAMSSGAEFADADVVPFHGRVTPMA